MKEQDKFTQKDTRQSTKSPKKKLIGFLVVLLIIGIGLILWFGKNAPTNTNSQEEFKTLIDAAETFVSVQNLDSALIKYKEAYAINPDLNVKNSIDSIQYQLDTDDEMLNEDDETDAVQPDQENYDQLISEGDRYLEQKDYVKAIKSYKKALKLNKTNQELKDHIKSVKEMQRQNRDKKGDTRRDNEIKLIDYEQCMKRGDNYFKAGKYSEAIEEYTKAKDIAPNRKEHVKKINEAKQKLTNP